MSGAFATITTCGASTARWYTAAGRDARRGGYNAVEPMARRMTAALTGEGRAELDCPRCGARVTVGVDPELLRRSTPIRTRARCGCGWFHAVYLERRAAVRRDVGLPGEIVRGERRLPVRVENLSRTGIRLRFGETPVPRVGERVVVAFTLTAGRPQRFERRTAIRWVDGDAAGGEFVDSRGRPEYDPVYDLALALHESR